MWTMFHLCIWLHSSQGSLYPPKNTRMKWEVSALPNFLKYKSISSPNFPYILEFGTCCELLGWHVFYVLFNKGNGPHFQPTEKPETCTQMTVSQDLSTTWMVLYYLSSISHDHLSTDSIMVFQRQTSSPHSLLSSWNSISITGLN